MFRIFALVAAGSLLFVSSAWALPPIPAYVKEAVAANKDQAAFVPTFAGLKMKCDVCHIPKADKKAKGHGLNDFGQAFHKHLDDKKFQMLVKGKMKADAQTLIKEAWEKAGGEKNAAGETYGELIKAGKLPGKNG